MTIAAQFQPGLNVDHELQRIDELASRALQWPVTDTQSLVDFLAGNEGFSGNSEEYYSVSNSLLNQVIATRQGIPISLALVYISVVQRLEPSVPGFSVRGINFPAHFLLAVTDSDGEHLIDPFTGRLIDKQDCYNMIAKLYGQQPEPAAQYFQTADNRQLLRRVLENLKAIYLRDNDSRKAIECLGFQLMLYPDDKDLLRQQLDLLNHSLTKNDDSASEHTLQ